MSKFYETQNLPIAHEQLHRGNADCSFLCDCRAVRTRGGYLMKAIKTMLYYFACFMTFIACMGEILVLAYWEWIF